MTTEFEEKAVLLVKANTRHCTRRMELQANSLIGRLIESCSTSYSQMFWGFPAIYSSIECCWHAFKSPIADFDAANVLQLIID